jgi:hypothetical protein
MRNVGSAEAHRVASMDCTGTTNLPVHADMDAVVTRRRAQNPAVFRKVSLWERRHDAAWAVVGDLDDDIVTDPKLSPHPVALDERCVTLVGLHDDIGTETPDLEPSAMVAPPSPRFATVHHQSSTRCSFGATDSSKRRRQLGATADQQSRRMRYTSKVVAALTWCTPTRPSSHRPRLCFFMSRRSWCSFVRHSRS